MPQARKIIEISRIFPHAILCPRPFDTQVLKYSRLRYPLQKFSSLLKAEPVYEGRLKVILLLQVSSHDFEPTFITFKVIIEKSRGGRFLWNSMDNGYVKKAKTQKSGQGLAFWAGFQASLSRTTIFKQIFVNMSTTLRGSKQSKIFVLFNYESSHIYIKQYLNRNYSSA